MTPLLWLASLVSLKPLESRGMLLSVIATESHRKSLLQKLLENGVDIAAAVEQGRYVSVDVAETLSSFMVNDRPDPALVMKKLRAI